MCGKWYGTINGDRAFELALTPIKQASEHARKQASKQAGRQAPQLVVRKSRQTQKLI